MSKPASDTAKGSKDSGTIKYDDITDKLIHRIRDSLKKRCAFYELVTEQVIPVFEQIKQTGNIPPEVYLFSIFEEEDYGYSERKLGLFPNLQSCEKLELSIRDNGSATKQCRLWKAP